MQIRALTPTIAAAPATFSLHDYYHEVSLTASGSYRVRAIATAKLFLQQYFLENANEVTSAKEIQQQLMSLFRTGTEQEKVLSGLCLRAFISQQIKRICLNLVQRFGGSGRFELNDILPLVLDGGVNERYVLRTDKSTALLSRRESPVSILSSGSSYQSLSDKILQTFDPARKADLTTWTKRLMLSHKALHQFLLHECDIRLISDWAILNDTTVGKLQRILSRHHSHTSTEIQQACQLLTAYHRIYRQQLQNSRAQGYRGKCPPPTADQLNQIAQALSLSTHTPLSSQAVLSQLHALASMLRQRRPVMEALDGFDQPAPVPDADDALQTAFLFTYRSVLQTALDEAIAHTIHQRLQSLQTKKEKRDRQFLQALDLFYNQGRSMNEIALLVQLGGQSQVSRLLKLAELRMDIRHHVLLRLKRQVPLLVQAYVEPEQLVMCGGLPVQSTYRQLEIALETEVERVMADDVAEVSANNRASKNLLAQRICEFLKHGLLVASA